MLRRVFLKCCVSASVSVAAFYGGMGFPSLSPAAGSDPFSRFERLLRRAVQRANIELVIGDDDPAWDLIATFEPMTRNDDNRTWKVIHNFDKAVSVFPPYSAEDALLCKKVFG